MPSAHFAVSATSLAGEGDRRVEGGGGGCWVFVYHLRPNTPIN